ncbi:hypothetical protein OHA98_05215 [Streptomyces sp. NBC_00654]|uniref:hypothetical protein n=1 Tax=Streptomyces sp. NBC_00654 TaxID=2975799 RepID=UPI002255C934|nr:hypothetical protein [Streptomyces sp. NBC_00654]MCX4964223.1 hypothetical protein [Streptomyces sp. NBC_00654]
MADSQSNTPLRAEPGAPTSGVIHVRTRLTAHFTVISNSLAQRPGSAVTVGVAAYILSLPDGARVSVPALCAHFTEGEILISRALRELEDAGYLERRRVRGSGGLIGTRTYFHDVPGRTDSRTAARTAARTAPPPVPPAPPAPPAPPESEGWPSGEADDASVTAPEVDAGVDATPAPYTPDAPPPLALTGADPQAVAILASLRIVDARLILSRREVAALAPAVTAWLAQGIGAEQITDSLTLDLPTPLRARPARILAYRLGEAPVAVPAAPAVSPAGAAPDLLPWQTCDGGCERAFRAARPGNCLDCDAPPESAGPADPTDPDSIKTVRAAMTDRADRAHRGRKGRTGNRGTAVA